MRLAGGDDVVVRLVLLEHEPHRLDIIAGKAPVALGVHVAEVELLLKAFLDAGSGAGDLAGDERLAPTRAFMVEEDAVDRKHVVALAVVDGLPVAEELGAGVGAAGVEGGALGLRALRHLAEHLAAGGLVEAHGQLRVADCFQEVDGSQGVGLHGVDRLLEADMHVRLGAEIVNLVGLHAGEDLAQSRAVDEVAVVQEEPGLRVVGITIQVIDAVGVERAAPADDTVNNIVLGHQEFRQIGPVLTGDAGDQRPLLLLVVHGRLSRQTAESAPYTRNPVREQLRAHHAGPDRRIVFHDGARATFVRGLKDAQTEAGRVGVQRPAEEVRHADLGQPHQVVEMLRDSRLFLRRRPLGKHLRPRRLNPVEELRHQDLLVDGCPAAGTRVDASQVRSGFQ